MKKLINFYRSAAAGGVPADCLETERYRLLWRGAEAVPGEWELACGEDDHAALPLRLRLAVGVGGEYPLGGAVPLAEMKLGKQDDFLRRIESGAVCERFDFLRVEVPGREELWGRVEYAARAELLRIGFDLFCGRDMTEALCFEFACEGKWRAVPGGAVLRYGGHDLRFTAQGAETEALRDGVRFLWRDVEARAERFSGRAVTVWFGEMPDAPGKVRAELFEPESSERPVRYLPEEDLFEIDMACGMAALPAPSLCEDTPFPRPGEGEDARSPFEDRDRRRALDRAKVTLENPTPRERTFCLRFSVRDEPRGRFRNVVFGFCPMLRSEEGEPTGDVVQISKSWNYFGEMPEEVVPNRPENDPARLYEGLWYSGYARVTVPPASRRVLEYTVAYAEWGGYPTISRAQLSIAGWGGCQLWEEHSLVPWTESLCIDPGLGLERSFIDDVRPIYCYAEGDAKFGGTENLGGADCLVWESGGQRIPLTELRCETVSQGPNLVRTRYKGRTADGSLGARYTFSMGRTDDVVRAWFEVEYEALRDTEYSRFTVFQMCADEYSDHTFQKFARGTERGTVESGRTWPDVSEGRRLKAGAAIPEGQNWFALFDGKRERGSDLFVLREWEASVRGRRGRMRIRCRRTENWGLVQPAWELYVPGRSLLRGDRVRAVVELICLPRAAEDYYGPSDYLREHLDMPEAARFQAELGQIGTEVRRGTLVRRYPVEIRAEDGPTAAEFSIGGGLGLIPVSVRGLSSPYGWELQSRRDGGWEPVDQAVFGNDFWQCVREEDGYQLAYNLPNSPGGTRQRNEYRLIRRDGAGGNAFGRGGKDG